MHCYNIRYGSRRYLAVNYRWVMELIQVQKALVALGLLVVSAAAPHAPFLDKSQVPRLENTPQKLNLLIITMHGAYPPDQAGNPLQLSESGKDLMKHVAELLVWRYEDHFRQLATLQKTDPAVIQVTSINKDIARESATHLIDGIKQYDKKLGKRLKMSLSDVNIDKNQFFDPLLLREQEKGKCKTFDDKAKKLDDPKTIKAGFMQGKFKGRSYEDVFQEYARMEMEYVDGQSLPDWVPNKKNDRYNMRNIAIGRMNNLIGGRNSFFKFFASTTLVNIFNQFGIPNSLEDPSYDPRLRKARLHLHVVDDHLMAALLGWLRVAKPLRDKFLGGNPFIDVYPQVGDCLFIEIDDRLELQVGFIRSVDELLSGVGFTPLTLHHKTVKEYGLDLADFVARGDQAYWLKIRLLYSNNKWARCCAKAGDCK